MNLLCWLGYPRALQFAVLHRTIDLASYIAYLLLDCYSQSYNSANLIYSPFFQGSSPVLIPSIRMHPAFLLLALMASFVPSRATPFPTEVTPAVASQCGQWDSIQTGTYILYQDLWNKAAGTGSQCSQLNSLSGSSLAWSSTWSWSGGSNQVKSYANAVVNLKSQPLSQYKTIPTTWNWRLAVLPYTKG